MMLIRFFDIVFACIGLVLFSPLFIIIAILIKIDADGPVYFSQQRIGRFGKAFTIYKFRTMHILQTHHLLITSNNDTRITNAGKWLRKYKIDELPQLYNVLKGEMSFVGPRPEVKKYTDSYTASQQVVLSIRPGITDYASLVYKQEQQLLSTTADPEKMYMQTILPRKIRLNKLYLNNMNVINYFSIILLTVINRTRFIHRKRKGPVS